MTKNRPRSRVGRLCCAPLTLRRVPLAIAAIVVGLVCLVSCGGQSSDRTTISPPEISTSDLATRLEAGETMLLLDVRTPGEFSHSRIEGAINIPHYEVFRRLSELESYRDRPIVVYCEVGIRSDPIVASLRDQGFDTAVHYRGGMSEWRKLSD